jgi:hypothetical protein
VSITGGTTPWCPLSGSRTSFGGRGTPSEQFQSFKDAVTKGM